MIIVRPVQPADAPELAILLNDIIARGGTTALQTPYTPAGLDEAYLTGPRVICCFVAEADGQLRGFQTLGHYPELPADVGDIGTFTRVGGTQSGVGTALFAATLTHARACGLAALNATIRADNVGGLRFYTRLGFADFDTVAGITLADGCVVARVRKRFAL